MNKADREFSILRTIYDDSRFASVAHSDRPDFILQHHHANESFGIEVTELYETESHARATYHPEYIGELLNGGQHMHRDDLKNLAVSTVDIFCSDGSRKHTGVPAILRRTPSLEQRMKAVADVLCRKDASADEYRADLDHINLIILDRFGSGSALDEGFSTADVFIPELRSALLRTKFREAFLVSTEPEGRQVYRPLQMLLLLESFYMFLGAVESFREVVDIDFIVPLFVRTMQQFGISLNIAESDGVARAIYRGTGIHYEEDRGVQVFDFYDHTLPPAVAAPPLAWPVDTIAAFEKHHANYVKANKFVTALGLDVFRPVDA